MKTRRGFYDAGDSPAAYGPAHNRGKATPKPAHEHQWRDAGYGITQCSSCLTTQLERSYVDIPGGERA